MAQVKDLIVSGASRFLNTINGTITNSEKLNGQSLTSTYSSTGVAPVTGTAVASAIGGLDVTGSSSIAASQTIKAWSETDGKVSITTQAINITKSQVSDFPSSMTPSSHTHGNIQNGGTLQTTDITIASGDKLVVTDSSDSSKVARTSISFDASTATKCLTQKGTWETFGTSNLAIGTTATTALAGDTKYAGASTAGGAATSAAKLTNTSKIGDTNKPVYFTASGVPSEISYTIDKSVPSTAVFTDANVTQTVTNSDSGEYELLFSGTADDTTHTEGARKSQYATFIPGSKAFTFGTRIYGETVGSFSVAEGSSVTASGNYSHAEGRDTVASGDYSHAEGRGTIANHYSQHVFGTYNIADPGENPATAPGHYVEIVGGGTGDTARSNLRTLDWSGNEFVAGNLSIGTTSSTSTDAYTFNIKTGISSGIYVYQSKNNSISEIGRLSVANNGTDSYVDLLTNSNVGWDGTNRSLRTAITDLRGMASLYANTTTQGQSIVNAWQQLTLTTLNRNSTLFATQTNGIKVLKAGLYLILQTGHWATVPNTSNVKHFQIYKNGTATGNSCMSRGNTYETMTNFIGVDLAANDVITVYAKSEGGTAKIGWYQMYIMPLFGV